MKLSRRAALTLPFGAMVTGCGSSPASQSMTLKLAQNSQALSYFPLFVAQEQGFFQKEGVTFTPKPIPVMGNGAKTAPGVESGSIEVAFGTVTDAFTLSRVDAYIRIIGGLCRGFAIDLIASRSFLKHTGLTEHSPLPDKVHALRGRAVGISSPGTATESFLIFLLRRYGLDYNRDIMEVLLGNVTPNAALAALASGRVDLVSWPMPTGAVAAAKGIGEVFISPIRGDVPVMSNMLYSVMYSRQQVIEAKPQAIRALIRAIAGAEAFLQANPGQTAALLSQFLQLDASLTKTLLPDVLRCMPVTPLIDHPSYDVANRFHVDAGLLTIALPYEQMVDQGTIQAALRQARHD